MSCNFACNMLGPNLPSIHCFVLFFIDTGNVGSLGRPNGVRLQAVIMLWILLLAVQAMMLLAAAHTAFVGV